MSKSDGSTIPGLGGGGPCADPDAETVTPDEKSTAEGRHGGEPATSDEDLLHTRVDNYCILSKIGGGGFGTVYRARDEKLVRDVALKFIHAPLVARFHDRFELEAQAIAALSKHPAIVQIYAWGEHGGRSYFAMEYVESTAEQLLERRPEGLAVPIALRIAAESAEALGYAHEKGIIHRDVKPSNLLIEEGTGMVKLADFGLVVFYDPEAGSPERTFAGSPAYMSPEQVRAEPVDPRSDVFSLGGTLHELLTGELPFEGDDANVVLDRILEDDRVPLVERKLGLPTRVCEMVDKALAHDPGDRYQTAQAFADDLRACFAGGRANEKDTCSRCLEQTLNVYPIKGACTECGAPICYQCWAADKRTCAAHAEA